MIVVRREDHAPRQGASDPGACLMVRVRRGDDAAFAELSVRYRFYVGRAITRLMGDDRQTEDLSQEVFLRVFRARKTYLASARFSTWLHTIIRNVVYNARRTLARRRETASGADPAVGHREPTRSFYESLSDLPVDHLIREEVRAVVQAAIAELCPRQQLAFRLYYLHGQPCYSIAKAMDTSYEAVRSLLGRAHANIRRSLAPYTQEGQILETYVAQAGSTAVSPYRGSREDLDEYSGGTATLHLQEQE